MRELLGQSDARKPSRGKPAENRKADAPFGSKPGTSACACAGGCPKCRGGTRIGSPGDRHEREADALARQALNGFDAGGPGAVPGVRGGMPPAGRSAQGGRESLGGVGEGKPLPAPVRNRFESGFAQDFGRVRIHQDDAAAESASALGAHAFTRGEDIVFARNRYAPDTAQGRELVAHELAHVVQQRKNPALGVQRKDDGSGKQPLLIDIARIDPVWSAFVQQQARRMKLSVDDPKVRAAAEKLTEERVGPTNYARWKAQSHPDSITLEPKTQEKAEEVIEKELEEEKREPLLLKNGKPWSPSGQTAEFIADADGMFARTKGMRDEVVRMEQDAEKLRTPDGWQGKVYQYGAGITGMIIGPTLGTAGKMMSLPVQKLIAKIRGKKDDNSVGKIMEGATADAVSGYQLTAGDLDEIYRDSRANHDRYMKAYRELNAARTELRNMTDNMAAGAVFAKAKAAKREMDAAYLAYMAECELLGIPVKAKHLESAMEDLAEGTNFALTTAATLPLGGGGVGKGFQAVLREGEAALEEIAVAGGKELLKDTAKGATAPLAQEGSAVGKEVLKDTAKGTTAPLSQEGAAVGKETAKDTVTDTASTLPKAANENVPVADDMVSNLSKEAANDNALPRNSGAAALFEEQEIKQAAGDGLVHTGKQGAKDALDPIVNAAGGTGSKAPGKVSLAPKGSSTANAPGAKSAAVRAMEKTQQIAPLKAWKIAKGLGFRLRKIPLEPEFENAGMKYMEEMAVSGLEGKAGKAAHDALQCAPRGADKVSKDMVGEFKTVAAEVTEEVMKDAMDQAKRYAKELGKPGVVVRILEMSTGHLYEIIPK
ncbi:MAG TPA: DUF4157 domain-containing protein [Fibrobacteria bacterium]|nr:DUF4157 domain-containing protein [Fibrobacteria bacterium]